MAEVHTWSGTADDNDSSPPDGAPEGMAPSTVNNIIREVMAAIRRKDQDENGSILTTGTSTAYAVTTNRTITELAAGMRLKVRVHTESGAAPTLNVNSLGAVEIRWPTASSPTLGAGQFPAEAVLDLVYLTITSPGWFVIGGDADAYGARRRVLNASAGAVLLNRTYLASGSLVALTLPSAANAAVGDEVELLALQDGSFTIAPNGSDVIHWSDFNVPGDSGTPRGFGGATINYHRACRIRKVSSGVWYGFVYSSFLE